MKNIITANGHPKAKDELKQVCKVLIEVEKTKDYPKFYSFLKTTKVPFISCYEKDVRKVYQESFRVLHRIGEVSIPVSVALSMHYYVLASFASYPFSKTSTVYWKREVLLNKIKKEGLLIANTGSVRTYKDASGNTKIMAKKENDSYIINGKAPFMSLAGIADYLVFTAELSEGSNAVFFIPSNNNSIVFEDSVFGDTMQGSFTKSVTFENLNVPSSNVIQLDQSEQERCEILVYQRSWFQALVPAPYLGAAYRVILQLKEFSGKKIKNGKTLSESERFSDTVGDLMIKYKAACQLCEQAGVLLEDFRVSNKSSLEKLFEASVVAKHFSTHYAEEIVNQTRSLMGTRFLTPGSITNKVYKEIVFGALQPMTDTDIRDYFGKQLMYKKI
ncbi:acyl-CoA dehydrogenase family protein [Aquimarina mytili]|uniref:Acyl-CoA/acyl-ACP dehydrogenase n=1 Tax=Aquimarina mytili TaxID=874423 RepID=A0A936ZZG3_9FLAO|nr:acyl-CoA dehydrogenase family protein [Aquimarina mytili]MBL0683986.1 acyl-CoA/acyl-ACP dehydrogenase [Aquimarina mytili]